MIFSCRRVMRPVPASPTQEPPTRNLHGSVRVSRGPHQQAEGLGDGPHPAGSRSAFNSDEEDRRLRRPEPGHVSLFGKDGRRDGGYGDVIKLAIFGHTHMDETHLLRNDGQSVESVAVKTVSSISPINGNLPSFTVVQIDPASAALKDYKVFAASNPSGVNAAGAKNMTLLAATTKRSLPRLL